MFPVSNSVARLVSLAAKCLRYDSVENCLCFIKLNLFLQVAPTRMNLGVFKGKQIAAKKGYDLLKSKADALKVLIFDIIRMSCFICDHQVRFRDICKIIYDTKVGMGDSSAAAFFSLTQAEYAAGECMLPLSKM